MSTSRPSNCWSSRAARAGALLLAAAGACAPLPPTAPGPDESGAAPPVGAVRQLPPFLDEFRQPPPRVATEELDIPSAFGEIRVSVARPATAERLPAVLLINGDPGMGVWLRTNAADLAGIGYVVMVVDCAERAAAAANGGPAFGGLSDERSLAILSAALRRLRGRPDVFADRVGVMGWSRGAGHALALAASAPVQACVVVDPPGAGDAALIAGLAHVPLLTVFSGGDPATRDAFRRASAGRSTPHGLVFFEGASAGFMQPGTKSHNEEAAGRAWFAIYEFLGKYVEDAPFNPPVAGGSSGKGAAPIADVGDLMRALHGSGGVWPALAAGLETEPADEFAWRRVRSRAAVLADAGGRLAESTPRKGAPGDWVRRAEAYAGAARDLSAAADARDFPAAKRDLQRLAASCRDCHDHHR